MATPVYICTGFLDSGKTTFIKDTLMKQEWILPGATLLIRCEEGEEEFSEEYLDELSMFLLDVDELEKIDFTMLTNCEKIYHPAQVVIEYNGMWDLQTIMDMKFPEGWEIEGVYSTVNGETLPMYFKNMRNLIMNQLVESELIVVNRCGDDVDRAMFRRSIKIQNPVADVLFENPEGEIIPLTEEDLPYDVKKDVIEIGDMDYGIWYVDAYEHPDRYLNKEITFLSQTFRPKGMPETMFIPGRQIMACCADDVEFYGYPTKIPRGTEFEQRGWATVKVRFAYESPRMFAPRQPVLYLQEIQKAEKPEEEIVYLG